MAASIQPQDIITPTSITLVRKDPLQDLPASVGGRERLRGFVEAVSLVASPKTDKDKFRPDVTMRQRHAMQTTFTRLPVQRGANVTDHSYERPPVLQFTGFITETPFIDITSALSLAGRLPGTSRVKSQLRVLEGFYNLREPIFVSTSVRPYDNMAISTFVVDKNPDTGAAVQVTLTLQQITTVDTLQIEPIPDTLFDQLGYSGIEVATSTAS